MRVSLRNSRAGVASVISSRCWFGGRCWWRRSRSAGEPQGPQHRVSISHPRSDYRGLFCIHRASVPRCCSFHPRASDTPPGTGLLTENHWKKSLGNCDRSMVVLVISNMVPNIRGGTLAQCGHPSGISRKWKSWVKVKGIINLVDLPGRSSSQGPRTYPQRFRSMIA